MGLAQKFAAIKLLQTISAHVLQRSGHLANALESCLVLSLIPRGSSNVMSTFKLPITLDCRSISEANKVP